MARLIQFQWFTRPLIGFFASVTPLSFLVVGLDSGVRAVEVEDVPNVVEGKSVSTKLRRTEFIAFSALVLDRKLTELAWYEDGTRYRAISNIDFNHFSRFGEVDLGGVRLLYIIILENRPSSHQSLAGCTPALDLVALSKLRVDYAAFQVMEGTGASSSRTMELLDQLHEHCDAHRAALTAQYKAREIARKAQAEYLRDTPPHVLTLLALSGPVGAKSTCKRIEPELC